MEFEDLNRGYLAHPGAMIPTGSTPGVRDAPAIR